MSGKINIFLLDKLNNLIEEINIIKPKTYEILNKSLKNNLKNLPEYFILFYPSSNNKEVEIHNNEDYQLLKDTLFIRQIEKKDLQKSIFEIAYDNLEESKRDIFDEKYNCYICTENIKHENPPFCYICQKIFHFKCLENWSKQKAKINEKLKCPYCNKELPLKEWKQKLDFEDNRKKDAEIINQLKRDDIIKNEMFDKFKEYKIKTYKLFKKILKKINRLNSLIKKIDNNILSRFAKEFYYDNSDLQIDNISNIIFGEFKFLKEYIKNNLNSISDPKQVYPQIKDEKKDINKEIINKNINKIKKDNIIIDEKNHNKNWIILNKVDYPLKKKENEENIQEHRNIIELKYFSKLGGFSNIFGIEFVNFNRNNIELSINDGKKKINLIDTFFLIKGENRIKLFIKNRLTNLSYMFYGCKSLKNIDELKYLDTKDVKNFSYLFWGCPLITDISPLGNWNVSNGVDFSYAFTGCSSLFNISSLEKWNVQNSTNFSYMFCRCLSLKDIKPLEKWNVSKGKDFSYMFSGCFILSNLFPIKNWNIQNGKDFEGMFSQCKSLENLNQLNNWKINKFFKLNK